MIKYNKNLKLDISDVEVYIYYDKPIVFGCNILLQKKPLGYFVSFLFSEHAVVNGKKINYTNSYLYFHVSDEFNDDVKFILEKEDSFLNINDYLEKSDFVILEKTITKTEYNNFLYNGDFRRRSKTIVKKASKKVVKEFLEGLKK